MKTSFYPKLAFDGIRKNRRLYFPYILTGSILVMMHYILGFLERSPTVEQMAGGTTLQSALPLGCLIIAAFSLLFLFYTNSFLIKERYREFGLYNVLGLDKRNIGKIMMWETLITAGIAIATGLILGIIMSKTAELILINMLGKDMVYTLKIGFDAMWKTVKIFVIIYLLLLLNSLIRVARSKPLELMKSNKVGERVPKLTPFFAVFGVILLSFAYYLSTSIDEPLTALVWFFVAVIFVIVATYLLFIAGSVVFCKLLQKNKRYYYKKNHFVSVSSMVYRMKRNGAGLASICVLLTMVLVMISSTACLYFGAEDAIAARCPNGINVSITFDKFEGIESDNIENLREVMREYSGDTSELTGVRACEVQGLFTEKGIEIDLLTNGLYDFSTDKVGYLSAISLFDYNILMNENETLSANECLIYSNRLKNTSDTFAVESGKTYKVKEHLKDFKVDGETLAMTAPVVYLVVEDLESFAEPFKALKNSSNDPIMMYDWRCGFDAPDSADEPKIVGALQTSVSNLMSENENGLNVAYCNIFSRTEKRDSFYDMYGSLFFLGIMLSIVFLMAAVLIIYYKQISEGYEDQSRFDIMQKVGMTKRDIKKSINSQMLTVFFLPLILAGLHLAFAFPFVSKILLMFAFSNTSLSVLVNLGCFAAFGILYAFVYKITSGAYYVIVSGRKGHKCFDDRE